MTPDFFKQNPGPLFLLIGSEPLLTRDWLDQARQTLRDCGYEDIQNLVADNSFDWQGLLEEGDMLSLFASHKCRIVSLASGKPGQKGARIIQQLCEQPPEDSIYIFVIPQLERSAKNTAWYKALQKAGEVVELKAIYANELPAWLMQRSQQKGLQIDRQSAAFLAERTEGNLLAADQELEKLVVRFSDQGEVAFDEVEASVGQSARYNHFVLVDACLAGKAARAFKIMQSLQGEGYVSTQIRWALQSALEQLNRLKLAQVGGTLNDRLWQSMRIWRSKQRLYEVALRRLSAVQIERLLQSCATLDRVGKGQQDAGFPNRDWELLRGIVARLSGVAVPL